MPASAHELLATNLHAVFGERDPERRRAAAEGAFAPDVRFVDPEETVVGVDALLAKAEQLMAAAPGFVLAAAGPAYVAGDRAALAWTFGPEGGEPVARGIDILTIADGRITELLTLLADG